MTQQDVSASISHTPRLAVSWLIVGIPLVYGVFQAVRSILPLFGG